MNNHTSNSQLDASAPGNPPIKPATNGWVTPSARARIAALLKHHTSRANALCNEALNVFWILDLEDKQAERIALAYTTTETLRIEREKIKRSGAIPSLFVVCDLATLNTYRRSVNLSEVAPPPPDEHYIAVCSANRFVIAVSKTRNSTH